MNRTEYKEARPLNVLGCAGDRKNQRVPFDLDLQITRATRAALSQPGGMLLCSLPIGPTTLALRSVEVKPLIGYHALVDRPRGLTERCHARSPPPPFLPRMEECSSALHAVRPLCRAAGATCPAEEGSPDVVWVAGAVLAVWQPLGSWLPAHGSATLAPRLLCGSCSVSYEPC